MNKKNLTSLHPTQRRKRISIRDAETIAHLTECERLNFKEATALLGIGYETWRQWLSRAKNAPRYDNIVARVKASYLRGQIQNIQDGAKGVGAHRRADWRASDRLLAIADRSRYGQQATEAPAPPTAALPPSVVNVWVEGAYGRQAQVGAKPTAAVVDATEAPIEDTWTPLLLAQKNEAPPAPPPAEPAPRKTRKQP